MEEKYEGMAVYRLKKKDGSEIWVEDHGRHVLDDKGNVLYHEGVMRDVTERLRVEQELIQAKEKKIPIKSSGHEEKKIIVPAKTLPY